MARRVLSGIEGGPMMRFILVLAGAAIAVNCSDKSKPAPAKEPAIGEAKPVSVAGKAEPAPAMHAPTAKPPAEVAAGTVKPPSTGKEMPVETVSMTPEQAKVVVAKVLERAKQPKADCGEIADALDLGLSLPTAYPKMTADAVPGYQVFQKCALSLSRWRAAIQAGVALLAAQPDK